MQILRNKLFELKWMGFFLIIWILFSGIAQAGKNIAGKQEDIRKLLTLTGSAKMGKKIIEQMISAYQEEDIHVPKRFWNSIMKEIKPDDIINEMIPIYDKYFSHRDIKELLRFYNSPTGKKIVEAQPKIAVESMTVGREWNRKVAELVTRKLKKNYISLQPTEKE